ncbi:MAG: alpha/beta fold hydrolase [Frankiales bacterium]|nr:alpha/beta fold hydrolase [Frankiales bacterium]
MTTLPLADGRTLDVRRTGDPSAPALVYHHGTPGSSRISGVLERAALARGLQVVSWSRPGYADSARRPGRTVADVVDDAVEVLDGLGVGTAVTLGWSGGGPHTLACGALRPDRFRAVGVIAGVAPFAESWGSLAWIEGMGQDNHDEFGAAERGEAALRAHLEPQQPVLARITADQVVESMASLLPDVDRAHCTDEFGDDLAAIMRDAVSVGVDGWIDDDLAFVRPWGFDLAAVEVPVSLWQGSADLMVPFAHGGWLAERLPDVRAHLLEGDGHLSVLVGRMDEILDDLLRA